MITVEQDGLHTDERLAAAGWLVRVAPRRPSSKIVVRTLLVADIGLLLIIGALLGLFMERPAGFVFAGGCWGLAGLLMSLLRLARELGRRRSGPGQAGVWGRADSESGGIGAR